MSHFHTQHGSLHADQVDLARVAAEFGTPTYVYSKAALLANFGAYRDACAGRDALVCYAMKANSNLAILDLLARAGAGFDIVSGGELQRVLAAGGDARKVIFSGVGKTVEEMRFALAQGILCFNVESIPELHRLNEVAGTMGVRAPVSLRVNPNVDAKTHPYIATGLKANKFGVAFDDALAAYRTAAALPHLDVVGIDCHIGSQLLDDAPLLEALDKLIELIDTLDGEGIALHHLDIGGGLGIAYGEAGEDEPVAVGAYLARLFARIDAWRAARHDGTPIKVIFEPGRSIVGNTGVLLTRVEFLKDGQEKNFCVVDAAMNDLMRPALYQAWMDVRAVQPRPGPATVYDVVGPVCESGDWLARERALAVQPGDLLCVMQAGAYGLTMASNYNTRGRAAEVMVDGARMHLVRRRETVAELYALEALLPPDAAGTTS
jgi:diaminopimelate decarboxylase